MVMVTWCSIEPPQLRTKIDEPSNYEFDSKSDKITF